MPNEDKWYISGPLGIGAMEPSESLQVDGSIYVQGEGRGLIVDESNGGKRIGFLKYNGREAGIWRVANQDFEIGRRLDVSNLPGNATPESANMVTDLYISGNGNVGIGTAEPSHPLHVKTDWSFLALDTNAAGQDAGIRLMEGAGVKWHIWNAAQDKKLCISREGLGPSLTINESGNVGITKELTVGAGGNALVKTRHIEGKSGQNDDADTLYLNWVSGKDVQVGEPSRRSNLIAWGNVGIGTPNPTSARLQFDNGGGDKVVVYDAGPADRYGFGLNSGNLNAFVPAGGHFSVRQNGHNGTEVMAVTGTGNVGIGTISPNVALHLGDKVPGAQARIQLDNANGQQAQLNRWTNRLEIRSSDAIFHTIGVLDGDYRDVLIVEDKGITVNGQAWKADGGNWAKISDLRLKKNIAPFKAPLDQLLKLQGVIFEWKEPKKHGNLTGLQRGFIAQEVEHIFPEWVGADSKGHKFITLYGFEALTIEAFRELKDNIDNLSKRIQKIESAANRNGTTRLEVDGVKREPFC